MHNTELLEQLLHIEQLMHHTKLQELMHNTELQEQLLQTEMQKGCYTRRIFHTELREVISTESCRK